MYISIALTGDKAQVLASLRSPATQADAEQGDCENAIRDALLDYLEDHAADAPVGVTVTVSCTYTKV